MLVRLGNPGTNPREVRKVHAHRQCAAAQGLDLIGQFFAVIQVSHARNHISTRSGAGQRAGPPDAARCSGDKNHAPRKAEIRCCCAAHHLLSLKLLT